MSSVYGNQLGFWQTLTRLSALLCEWLAASRRPRPWAQEGLLLSRHSEVCFGQWQGHCWPPASLQPRGRPSCRKQPGQRQPREVSWWGGTPSCPGLPVPKFGSPRPFQKPAGSRQNVRGRACGCIAMFIVFSLFSSLQPPVPRHMRAGEVAKPS